MRMESDEFDFLAPAYVRGFLRPTPGSSASTSSRSSTSSIAVYGRRRIDTSQLVRSDSKRRVKAPRRTQADRAAGPSRRSWPELRCSVLALIGLMSGRREATGPSRGRRPRQERRGVRPDPASSPTASPTPTPTPTPTPSPTPSEPGVIAVRRGDRAAGRGRGARRCWVDITADGGRRLRRHGRAGGATEVFTADRQHGDRARLSPRCRADRQRSERRHARRARTRSSCKFPRANGEPFYGSRPDVEGRDRHARLSEERHRLRGSRRAARRRRATRSRGRRRTPRSCVVNTCGFIDPARRETIEEVLDLAELKTDGRLEGLWC